jgi:hypothetical protein
MFRNLFQTHWGSPPPPTESKIGVSDGVLLGIALGVSLGEDDRYVTIVLHVRSALKQEVPPSQKALRVAVPSEPGIQFVVRVGVVEYPEPQHEGLHVDPLLSISAVRTVTPGSIKISETQLAEADCPMITE